MTGPHGEKLSGDVIANAVHVAKLATGDIKEGNVDQTKRAAGLKAAGRAPMHGLRSGVGRAP